MYGRLLNPYSIEKAVRAFVHGTGVRVHFDQKDGGYTDGKDIHIERLRMDMTEEEAMCIYGTVVHELGHILYSDFSTLSIKKETELRKSVWNLLEDSRMEYLVSGDAIGWQRVLNSAYSIDVAEVLRNPEVMEAGSSPLRMFLAFDIVSRAKMFKLASVQPMLNELVESFNDEEGAIWEQMQEYLVTMLDEVMPIKDKVEGTEATWRLMDSLMKLLGEEEEEQPEEGEGGEEGEGEPKEGEGEPKEGEGEGSGAAASGSKTHEGKEGDMEESSKYLPASGGAEHKEGKAEHGKESSRTKGKTGSHDKYKTTPVSDLTLVDYSKGETVDDGGYQEYESPAGGGFHSGGLANKVRRLLQIRSRSRVIHGRKKGKLDARNLYRVGMRNDSSKHIFKGKTEAVTTKDAAVYLLIDCSGSMSGALIRHAMDAAGQMSTVLKNLGIPHAITGFTVDDLRTQETMLYLLKQFNENPRDLGKRMENASSGLYNNHDGEAVLYAEAMLDGRPENGKTIIVFSDGVPCGPKHGCGKQLKDVVKKIDTRKDMNIYGVGIMTRSVERYYKQHIVINDSDDLENALLGLITKVV